MQGIHPRGENLHLSILTTGLTSSNAGAALAPIPLQRTGPTDGLRSHAMALRRYGTMALVQYCSLPLISLISLNMAVVQELYQPGPYVTGFRIHNR